MLGMPINRRSFPKLYTCQGFVLLLGKGGGGRRGEKQHVGKHQHLGGLGACPPTPLPPPKKNLRPLRLHFRPILTNATFVNR